MKRVPKPQHDGQGVLWAAGRSRRKYRRNGRSTNSESALVTAMLKWADLHRDLLRIFRVNAGKIPLSGGGWLTLAPEGTPDMIGWLRDGRFIGVEAKLPGQEIEPGGAQESTLRAIAASGGVGIVAHTVEELARDVRAALSRGVVCCHCDLRGARTEVDGDLGEDVVRSGGGR